MGKTTFDILLIEDDPADVILLKDVLGKVSLVSFQLTVAEQLSQGLSFLKQQRFDMVLLDLGLPDSQGLESFQKLHTQNPELPVLVLSDLQDEELAIAAVQAGAQDYLVKGQMGGTSLARAIRHAIERHQLHTALRESEQYYRALIEHSAEAVIALAADGTILYESLAATRMWQYLPEELHGHSAFDFIHPADRALSAELFQQLLQQPSVPFSREIRYRSKDGSWRWIEGTSTNLLAEPAVQAIVVNYRDITQRKQAEEELRRSVEQVTRGQHTLQALGLAAQAAQRGHTPQAIYQAVGSEIKKLGFNLVIYDLDVKKREMGVAFMTYAEELVRAAETFIGVSANAYRFPLVEGGYYDQALSAGQAVLHADVTGVIAESLPALLRPLASQLKGLLRVEQGIHATLMVNDNPQGIIVVLGSELGEADVPAVDALAAQLSIALENARLYQEALSAAERLTVLHRNSQTLVYVNQNIEQVYAAAHQAAAQLMPTEVFTIVLLDEKQQDLDGVYLFDKGGRSPSQRIPFDKGFSSQVIFSGEAILIKDLEETPLKAVHFGTKESARSLVAVPMRVGDHVFGAISAQSYRAETYDDEDRRLLEMLAAQVAVAIQNVRLFEQAQQEIAERKQAEEALRESSNKILTLFSAISDGITVANRQGQILEANEAAAAIHGFASKEEYLKSSILELVPEAERLSIQNDARQVIQSGGSSIFQHKLRRQDGSLFDGEIKLIGSTQQSSGELRLIAVTRDITERKLAEEKLRESESMLKEAQTIANLGSYVLDISTGLWKSSDVLNRVFGIDEAYGHSVEGWTALIHPDDRTMMTDYFRDEVLGQGQAFDKEYRILRHNDQAERWVHGFGELEFDAQGHPVKMHGTIQDVTKHKRMEAERLWLLHVLESSLNEIYLFNAETLRFEYVNAGALRNLGYTRAAIETMTPLDLKPEFDEVSFRNLLAPLLSHERAQLVFQTVYRRANASLYPVEVHLQLVERHGVQMFLAIILDIAERQQAEAALRESEEKYRTLIDEVNDGFYVTDSAGVFTFTNPALARMYGFEGPEALVGRKFTDLVAPELQAGLGQAYRGAMQTGHVPNVINGQILRSDGTHAFIEIKSAFIVKGGQITGSRGVVRDITERKQAEAALTQQAVEYKTMLSTITEGFWLVDEHGRLLDANEAYCSMSGYSKEELLQFAIPDIEAAESLEDTAGHIQTIIETGTHRFESKHKAKDGRVFDVEVSAAFWHERKRFFVFIQDITERKQTEAKIAKLSNAVEQSADMVFMTNQSGVIEYVNPAFEAITGYHKAEVLGQTPKILKSGLLESGQNQRLWVTILAGKVFRREAVDKKKNGEIYYYDQTITPLKDAKGNITHFVSTGKDITERKQAEEKLRESEKRFKALIENAADVIVVIDAEGLIQFASPTIERMLGYKPEETLGKSFLEWVHPDNLPAITYSLAHRSQTPGTAGASVAARGRHKDGSWRFIEAVGTNLLEEPAVKGIVLNMRDVTARFQVEERLRKLSRAVEQSASTIVITDKAGTIEYVNPRFTETTGYSFTEALGQNPRLLKSGYTAPETYRQMWAKIAAGEEWHGEFHNKRKNGELYWETATLSPILNEQGEITHYLAVKEDVTERKQTEQKLRESEARYRLLFEQAPLGLTVSDSLTGRFYEVNPRFAEIVDRSMEEMVHIDWMQITHPDDVQADLDNMALMNAGKIKGFQMEKRFLHPDGTAVWINMTIAPLRIEEKDHPRHLSMIEDITERKQTEQKLRESEARYRLLFENAPLGIVLANPQGQVLEVNPTALRLLGTPSSESAKALNLLSFPPLKESGFTTNFQRCLDTSQPISVEGVYTSQRSKPVYASYHFTPIFDDSPQPALIQTLIQDITTRKQAEEKLRASEERFTQLANNTQEAFWMTDIESEREIYLNPAAEMIWGKSVEEMMTSPTSFLEMILPEDRPAVMLAGAKHRVGEKTELEYRVQQPDGSIRWVWDRAFPIYNDKGKVTRVAGLAADITQRKQAEEALHVSEEKFRSITEQITDVVYVTDARGLLTYISPATQNIFGFTPAEMTGRPFWEFLVEAEIPKARGIFQRALTSGVPSKNLELQMRRSDHSIFVGELNGQITQPDGQPGTFGIIRDVTERKLAEAEINHHLSELEVLYESGLALSRLLNPQEIGQRLIEVLEEKLDWHHAAIRLYHPETEQLELLALGQAHVSAAELQEQITRLNQIVTHTDQGLSGWVIKHGEVIRSADLLADPRYVETYVGMRSGLYVPLQIGGNTIGVISVESERENAFIQQDERLLLTLASQAAIAIKNAQLFSSVLQELHDRTLAEEQLRESERFAHATIDALPEHICVLDDTGVIIAINRAWREFAESNPPTPPNFWEGINYLTVCDTASGAEAAEAHIFAEGLRSVMRGDQEQFTMEYICNAPWEARWFLAKVTRFPGEGQLRLVISHENVTARQQAIVALQRAHDQLEHRVIERTADLSQANAELDQANVELKRANRLKDEFLSSMSHELRTPLTGILGLSEALQLRTYGELSDKQLKALHNIEASGRHLLELINDILDLSKIEAGRLEMQLESCALADVCQASLQLTKGMAHQKRQYVSFAMNPAALAVRADARRLKQMLVNLLSNAIKFTPEDGHLGLDVQGDEAAQLVKLTVWDQGIGIKPENINQLFKPFVQLDSSLARQYSGTGLGLSLVQRMAELHGGSVQIESTFGEGSRFTILLPWSASASPVTSGRRPGTAPLRREAAPAAAARLILIADDNEVVLETLSDFLQAQHYRVVATHSGQELLTRAAELRPDLLLVDIQMPGMDGLETIHRLRTQVNAQVASTPVIAVTALAMPGDRARCLAAGANEYLSKPVHLTQLLQTIHDLLSQAENPHD